MQSAKTSGSVPLPDSALGGAAEPTRISASQWRSGIAAWLGWTFDGLDMHLYTLIAAPFVAQLLGGLPTTDKKVGWYGSLIQGGFLLGWALGGGFFGRIGDRMGRARALCLTVLTYAACTGLSFFATRWWHLFAFRFLAALGIGGEWAVGASLLAETWPRKWRPWIAAVLQSGVNIGVLAASLAVYLLASAQPRYVFLVGILPALLVLWVRRAVPEPEEWMAARSQVQSRGPGVRELFRGETKKITIWVVAVCAISLTAHWAFMFWHQQHLRNLPDVARMAPEQKTRLASLAMYVVMVSSIVGNFFAGGIARYIGYRAAAAGMFCIYFLAMLGAYSIPRTHESLMWWFAAVGFSQGVFALFTMYLPPLFPTLLRTTGAGFSYNIGRTVAAFGTVFFGMFATVGDYRIPLLAAGFLFLPAAIVCFVLPKVKD